MIRGVKFLFDERGGKTAVMIDLRQGRGLWEDILDVATARLRDCESARLPKAGRGFGPGWRRPAVSRRWVVVHDVRIGRSATKELESLPGTIIERVATKIDSLAEC